MIEQGTSLIRGSYDRVAAVWVGCGDMYRRAHPALEHLQEEGARMTLVDVKEVGKIIVPPPGNARFFNISDARQRRIFHQSLIDHPATHIYLANLPHQHLPTAILLAGKCPDAQIVIAKPLDTNFLLIETIANGVIWPGLLEHIFQHDHYLNKGVVEPLYQRFPELITTYGRVKSFEGYLVEHRTIEDEGRLEALNTGVICDLESHLFALTQQFFLSAYHPALVLPDIVIKDIRLVINQVCRARYANCQLENENAETFAAIAVSVIVEYRRINDHPKNHSPREPIVIPGLLAAGKGIKPSSSIRAGLKGMRFNQELQPRAMNLTSNLINPPLNDLDHVAQETGFHAPVITALSTRNGYSRTEAQKTTIPAVMSFRMAAQNAHYLHTALNMRSPLRSYKKEDTLEQVLAQFVSRDELSPSWLPKEGYGDIGFS